MDDPAFVSSQQLSQRIKHVNSKIKKNKRQQYLYKLISLRNSVFLEDECLDKSAQTIEHDNNVRTEIHTLIGQIQNYSHSNKAFISQQHHSQSQRPKQHKKHNKAQPNHNHQTIMRKSTIDQVSNAKPYRTLQNNRYTNLNLKQLKNSSSRSLRKISKGEAYQNYMNGINNGVGKISQKIRFIHRDESIPLVKRKNRYEYKRKGKQYFHIQINKNNIISSSRHNNSKDQILPQIKVNGKYTTDR